MFRLGTSAMGDSPLLERYDQRFVDSAH